MVFTFWSRCSPGDSSLLVVVEQAEDVELLKSFATLQKIEFDSEAEAGNAAAELANKLHCGLHRAACGQQVVDDYHVLPRLDRIHVDLERITAVFQIVGHLSGGSGQFARLAYRDEARVESIRERGTEDEAACFDAKHQVDVALDVMRCQRVDQHREAKPVL